MTCNRDDNHQARHIPRQARHIPRQINAAANIPVRAPKCGCGLEMAYNGQRGWYCLRCG